MNLTAGTTLQGGKYFINRVLGQGVLSVTFQGTQVQSNRPVVLKTLKQSPQVAVDFTQLKQRFTEQSAQFAQCQHPGLVRLIDSFEEAGFPFAVMDYTAGQTVLEVVQANGPLSEELAAKYAKQVGSALDEIHQHGLIHRDVTPKNIICLPGVESVVLVNFGITHPAVLGWTDGFAHPPAAEYAAIEQYQPQLSPTPATDIYSLAGTLYFMLTGYAPVAAPLRHRSPLLLPQQFCSHLDLAIESAILKGLELNPKSRPQTIATWLSLLASGPSLPMGFVNPSRHVLPEASGNGTSKSVSSPQSASSLNGKTMPSSTHSSSAKGKKPIVQATKKPSLSSSSPSPFFRTLVTVSAIAASLGLGAGLLLRLAAGSTGPGTSIFHTEQSFPTIKDWSSTAAPVITPPTSVSIPEPDIKRELPPKATEPEVVASPRTPQIARPEPQLSPQNPTAEIAPLPGSSTPTTSVSPTPAPSIATPDPASQNPDLPPPAPAPTPEPSSPSSLSVPASGAEGT